MPYLSTMRNIPFHNILFGSTLLFFLFIPCKLYTQQPTELIINKLAKAEAYFEANLIDSLFVVTEQLEEIIKDTKSLNYGKTAYYIGEYWHAEEEWTKALGYFNAAIPLLQQDTSAQKILAESYLVGGYCLYELDDFDQTLIFYENALKIREKIYGENHLLISNLYFNLGIIQQEKRDLLASDALFLKGIDILNNLYSEENEQFADFYEELGFNQNSKGDYNAGIKYLDKALAIKTATFGKNHPETAYAYEYLGRLYKSLDEYDKAIIFFNKALHITEEQKEKDIFKEGMLNLVIGKSYIHKKEAERAYQHFDKAVAIDKTNEYIIPEIDRLKGIVESKRENSKLAWQYFEKSLAGFQKNKTKNAKYIVVTQRSMVEHLIKEKNYTTALIYLDKTIDLGKIYLKDSPSEFFDLYKNKGICYLNLGQWSAAIQQFKKADKINGRTINRDDANLIQLKNKVALNLEYAKLYTHPLNPAYNLSLLKKTDTLLSETINLISYITRTYQERSTKENFIEQSYGVFKKAITIKYQLYKATQEEKYLLAAFVLSEKSKNLILLETLKNVKAFELSGIPDTILSKESELKTNITYLENKRYEEQQQKHIDHKTISSLNHNLFDLKRQYESLLAQLAEDYPKYYQLKFESTAISINEIQQNILKENQSILEYFIADSSIYTFLITKKEFKVFQLEKSIDLTSKINQFRKSIYSYRPFDTNKLPINNDTKITASANLGVELYQELIVPLEQDLTQKITIIADGALGYLPFDALLKTLPSDKNQFRAYDYLINDYLISYAHSVNWLNDLLEKEVTQYEQDFVGIAPIFEGTKNINAVDDFRGRLDPLKHNQEEVKNIRDFIGGQILIGTEATRRQFLAHIQKGKVLHLATHGKANDAQGEYSFLAFANSKDSLDNRFLYVKDLFNLKIPAELVVLSACETGLGEIKRGEGIVGIGKGFSYAGVKSLVTTLWRVSDNSTANFMPLFYKNLKKGMPKDEALWNAKKTFIKENRNAGHPFFWSGYVAYGDMQPMQFKQSCYLVYITGVFLTLLGLLLWKFRFK